MKTAWELANKYLELAKLEKETGSTIYDLVAADADLSSNSNELMAAQGVKKTTPQNALQELREKLNIRRNEHGER